MRNFSILFLFLFLSISLTGQRSAKFWWFDAGLKAQYGATGLFNPAIADSENYRYDISTGYSYGAKLGLNKGTHGFTIDFMLAELKQSFEIDDKVNPVENQQVKWNTHDLYTLYRNNRQLGYVEIGPKFTFMKQAEISDLDGGGAVDVLEFYNNSNINAVLGFGAYFIGSDGRFSGILGLRLEYGLTDIVNESGHAAGTPVQDVQLFANGVETTHPLFAGLSFELNWGIGYYGKASCGGRAKFIKF